MLFKNEESSLKLDVVNYEFPPDGGAPGSDDRNWLVLRATWVNEDGLVIKDSNSCLLTYELQEMTAGLKVVKAGLKQRYESEFAEPYFMLSADAVEGGFRFFVSFTLPNTMEDEDVAELYAHMTMEEMTSLIAELDGLCRKFPDRT
ncbi:MAG: hypothetical protein E7443_02480 [Ruminococcaceae bacterium]|nr:hypothetical protein [Oscillospiraceae bacterium]